MSETLYLFTTGDENEIKNIEKAFSRLNSIQIQIVTESPLLNGRVNLPFIETQDGRRYVGLNAIMKLVDRLQDQNP